MVMTRIRLGAGKGSWSAACSTRVARRASIAIGLSKSAIPPDPGLLEDGADDWSAARLLRSRSPGSVIARPSCRSVSRGTESGGCTCSTWNNDRATGASAPSPCPPRHDHHGSGSIAQLRADCPRMNVPHTCGFEFGEHPGQLVEGPRTDEGDQLRPRPEEPTAPAGQPGEASHGPSGDHVHRPPRAHDGAVPAAT